jgi:hypothetical protein
MAATQQPPTCDGHPLQRALKDAYMSRGQLYVAFYRAIARRHGGEAAREILKEAIYDWGSGLAAGVSPCAPANFAGLNDAFFSSPDGGEMFQPRIGVPDQHGVDAHFLSCPLKEAWIAAGLSDGEVAMFCDIASSADYGTLEAAGFAISIETWKPGLEGCCSLKVRQRP